MYLVKLFRISLLGTLLAASASVVYADAPVEDISQPQDVNPNTPYTMNPSGAPVQVQSLAQNDAQAPKGANAANTTDNTTESATTPVNNPPPPAPVTTNNNTVSVPNESLAVTDNSGTQNLPIDQRVTRLEQQMQNFTQMNLPQEISELQQEVAQLRGQLQMQEHDLKLLNEQQRSFYQDLDQRITQLKNLIANSSSDSSGQPPAPLPRVQPKKKLKPAKAPKAQGQNDQSDQSDQSDQDSQGDEIKDANAYQAAFGYLSKKQYDKAHAGLVSYLKNYPDGSYRINAHYWLGEIYLLQKQPQQAQSEFRYVIKHAPHDSKVPDAKLKLGLIAAAQGHTQQAESTFKAIKKLYPNSTAAQLATIQLQQLEAQ